MVMEVKPFATAVWDPNAPKKAPARFETLDDDGPDEVDVVTVDFAPRERRLLPRYSADKVLHGRLRGMAIRADEKGLAFDLDEEWLKAKLALEFCEVTGIKFSGKSLKDPFTQTIDRTDNSIGYTKANCKVVVWIYNQAKKDHGAEHVLIMARALVAKET